MPCHYSLGAQRLTFVVPKTALRVELDLSGFLSAEIPPRTSALKIPISYIRDSDARSFTEVKILYDTYSAKGRFQS